MGKPHPDTDTRVQALIHAAVYGDAAAAKAFGYTARSLRNWRAEVRAGDTEFSRTFRTYVDAISPESRAQGFADWMEGRVRALTDVFIEKAQDINPNNPEALRALTEMTRTLLEHLAALTFLRLRFAQPERDDDLADDLAP